MFRIVEIGRRLTAPVETLWGDVGITPTQGALLARLITTHGGKARSGDLLGYPIRSTPALAKVLAGLEEGGFLERTKSADDRRAVDVRVTDEGRALFVKVLHRIEETVSEPTARGLTDHQLDELNILLNALEPPEA